MAYVASGYWVAGYAVGDVTGPVVAPALRRYATAQRYLDRYGWVDGAQLLADEERLLTEQLLRDVVAGSWTGSPSALEQAAAAAALARLERQLAVSSNFMDGYLRAAVTLPLAADDVNATTLEDCCLALARCGLADDADNATTRIDKACETWRVWLKDVQAGRVQLVAATAQAPDLATAVAGRVRTGRAVSGFDWGTFGAR
jgi:phage gp36-like protein